MTGTMRYRKYIASILARTDDLQVICEASDGLEAVHKAEELKPDLILLDIGLPTLNGIEAARQIRQKKKCARSSQLWGVGLCCENNGRRRATNGNQSGVRRQAVCRRWIVESV